MTDIMTLNHVTVAYDAKAVLWDIQVSFKKGALTAVIGPNGAGKSTMMKAMLDLVKPLNGDIDYHLADQPEKYKTVKKKIAYVPQNTSVDWDFPATVLDVVVMGRYGHLGWLKRPTKKDFELAKEMLVKVGMPTFANRQISQLSGGQRQRVFLARALAQEAEIYLMDEPFAGVDQKTEKIIMDLLKELKEAGKSIIVVHHDLQTVEDYFDEVVFVNRHIVASGPVDTVFTKEAIEETYRVDHNLGEEGGLNDTVIE
jgi:manganese/zinc/iron transport system ATP- binding protein